MQSGITYGGLNDWAMTFQMNNVVNRGFWWGHEAHTTAQGAMSLTTAGHLTVGARVDAPIFYDSNNTGFYCDPASTSNLNTIIINGQSSMATQKALVASNYGHGVYGLYDPTRYQHVWSMDASYSLAANGTSTGNGGNLYGLAWAYNPNYSFSGSNAQAKAGLNHQLLLMMNGITHFAAGSGVWTSGTGTSTSDWRAPIFYDSNNTAYYCDPNSTSYLDAIGRRAHHRGHLVGSYNNIGDNSSKSNPIYTIGSAYNPNDASLGNMYGVGYSHSNFFGTSLAGSDWGFYVAAAGTIRVILNANNGNIGCTGNVTAYASDERLKTNIKRIEKPLEKLKLIDGVTYDWIDECEELGFIPDMKHEHGVIAQHVQEVIPDAVKTAPFNDIATERTGEDRNYLTVDKEKIIPLLIEAIKEQQTQIEALTSEINTLKEMIK
jgi:hypothetical protein